MPAAHRQLSQTDLRTIAWTIHRDFSPMFASAHRTGTGIMLTRQELQDIAEQIRREFTPTRDSGPSQLTLLPISPKRLHAYWRIADTGALHSLQTIKGSKRLILRVYRQTAEPVSATTPSVAADEYDEWLDVLINAQQGQDDIALPESATADVSYRAAIGTVDERGLFQALIRSQPAETIVALGHSRPESLPPSLLAFIMPNTSSTSTVAKSGSGQGNFQSL